MEYKDYDIALKEMQLEPQNVWNKYIRLAEQSQEQGMNQNHDTFDLARSGGCAGYKWYNNGITEMCTNEPPTGTDWIRGRLKGFKRGVKIDNGK